MGKSLLEKKFKVEPYLGSTAMNITDRALHAA
jgi:hypothetical protein